MLPEQPPERRPHPLEEQSAPPPPIPADAPRRTPVTLRIPAVSPTATYVLIAINVLVFIARAVSVDIDDALFSWGANNPLAVFGQGELHRLFSSMFLHASIHLSNGQFAFQNALHLILNAYIIYVTGRGIEPLFGHLRFALIYLLGGLAGSIASALLSPPTVYSVGASGAAFAILGAEFVYLYKHRRLLGERGRAQMGSLITLGLVNLAFGILTSLSTSGARIDNWGHIGGALGGAALAWFIAPFFLPRRDPTRPDTLIAEDINPLKAHIRTVSMYIAALMLLLIIGSLLY